VVGDLARIDDVGRLADQAREHGPIDAWVHNAGVWVRGSTPRTSADGHETTFAVNVLAPHLLTHLLAAELQGRLLWLGSGLAGSARPQPAALGRETDPRRAYAESKACDVALALAWNRRLPDVISVAVDPIADLVLQGAWLGILNGLPLGASGAWTHEPHHDRIEGRQA